MNVIESHPGSKLPERKCQLTIESWKLVILTHYSQKHLVIKTDHVL